MNATTKPSPTFLDCRALLAIQNLELRAKSIVEGCRYGLNRSPWHGFSVEFSEYREYRQGDDLRYLDWKLYARRNRLYIKQFQDETNLCCQLVLDMSQSMAYGSNGYSKADYARTLVATFSYFLKQQQDAVGLLRFSDHVETSIPPRHRIGQFRRILSALDSEPSGKHTTTGSALKEVAEQLSRRGLVVLITDFLFDSSGLQEQLALVQAAGHDVLVFHVIDPAEKTLDLSPTQALVDLESGRRMTIDVQNAKAAYSQRFQAHCDRVQSSCEHLGIDYQQLMTDAPFDFALSQFLRQRMQQGNATPLRRVA